jgi:hypothetical protein
MSDSNGIARNDPSILDIYGQPLKEDLAAEIKDRLEQLALPPEQAAQALRLTPGELTTLLHGNLDNYSVERLEDLKIRLGLLGHGAAGIRKGQLADAEAAAAAAGDASDRAVEGPAEQGPDLSGPM